MIARIIGVFKLDKATFEEIEHNNNLTLPAGIIVIVVSLLAGLGNGFFNGIFHRSFFSGFFGALVATIIGWILWSVVTWFVGTRLFQGQAQVDEMMRVIGFAYVPMVLAIIPCVGHVIGIIWAIAAGFIAIRQGLDLDDMKTFLTIIIGVFCYAILMGIVNFAI